MSKPSNTKEIKSKIRKWSAEIFRPSRLDMSARGSGLVQRSTSKLTGSIFFKAMLIGAENPEITTLEGYCEIIHELNKDSDLTPQAISQRINRPQAAEFLNKELQDALQQRLKLIMETTPQALMDENSIL